MKALQSTSTRLGLLDLCWIGPICLIRHLQQIAWLEEQSIRSKQVSKEIGARASVNVVLELALADNACHVIAEMVVLVCNLLASQ